MADKQTSEPSNKDIMNLLRDFMQTQKAREENLNQSINSCHEKLDANIEELNKINNRLDSYAESLVTLKNESNDLRQRLTSCTNEMDKLEQYTRRNSLEIHGIPFIKGEDPYLLIQKVASALSIEISKNSIDICHRLPLRSSEATQKPPAIICKFVNRYLKEDILGKRKVMRNLSTTDIGFTTADTIYINENLTTHRRQLLYKARQLQKELHFKFLWTKNGNIFARKDEKSPVTEVTADSIKRIKLGGL
ncbi:uncharacterized protein LOC116164073 [Photinus pyralis]|nr:uncharacterized protein LOC116164073 [Photinus pyralis]